MRGAGPGSRAAIVQGGGPAADLAGNPGGQAGEAHVQPAGEQARAVFGHDLHRGQDLDRSLAADAVPDGDLADGGRGDGLTVAVAGQQRDEDPLHATAGVGLPATSLAGEMGQVQGPAPATD